VKVDDVRFTHNDVRECFGDGRKLGELIDDLMSGVVSPLRDDFMVLECVWANKKWRSLNNRRLFCLKEFQKLSGKKVMCKIKVSRVINDPVLNKFMRSNSTKNGGASVVIRRTRPQAVGRRR